MLMNIEYRNSKNMRGMKKQYAEFQKMVLI